MGACFGKKITPQGLAYGGLDKRAGWRERDKEKERKRKVRNERRNRKET